MSTSKSIVIIPTYNERHNALKMIDSIFNLYSDLSILIIDDGSPDGTGAMIKENQKNYPQLFLIERAGKLGLGTAYIRGFKWALENGYTKIVTMDCDFSHDPAAISDFLEQLSTHDLVVGSRYIDGIRIMNWPMHRLLLSYFASIYARCITGIPFLDSTGGFNAYTEKALRSLKLDQVFSIGYAFQIELKFKIWSKKLPSIEIPITFYERTVGQSKMSKNIIFEAVFNVFLLRLKKIIGTL